MGFGLGDVSLQNFLETHQLLPAEIQKLDVFVLFPRAELLEQLGQITKDLRQAGLSVAMSLENSGFGAQLKNADRLGARFAVIPGDDELAAGEVMVKNLQSGEQQRVAIKLLATELKKLIPG